MAIILVAGIAAADIAWEDNLDEALKDARESQKPIMVSFYTEHCGWCKKLDAETYTNADVSELSSRFICVKVDGLKDKEISKKYLVRGYPTIIFLNHKGEINDTLVGFRPAPLFLASMNSVLDKAPLPSEEAIDLPVVKPVVPEVIPRMESGFCLTGTAVCGKANIAIINNVLVKVNETVDGAKVIKIEPKRVTLRANGRDLILRLIGP